MKDIELYREKTDPLPDASLPQADKNKAGEYVLCLGELTSSENNVVVRVPSYSKIELGSTIVASFFWTDNYGDEHQIKSDPYLIDVNNINYSAFDVDIPKKKFTCLDVDCTFCYSVTEISGNQNASNNQQVALYWNSDDVVSLKAAALPQASLSDDGSYQLVLAAIDGIYIKVNIELYSHASSGDVISVNFLQRESHKSYRSRDYTVTDSDIKNKLIQVLVPKSLVQNFECEYLLGYKVSREVELSIFQVRFSEPAKVFIKNKPSNNEWYGVKNCHLRSNLGNSVEIYSNGLQLAEIYVVFTPCNVDGDPVILPDKEIINNPNKVQIANLSSREALRLVNTPDVSKVCKDPDWSYCISPNDYVKGASSGCVTKGDNYQISVARYVLMNRPMGPSEEICVGAIITPISTPITLPDKMEDGVKIKTIVPP